MHWPPQPWTSVPTVFSSGPQTGVGSHAGGGGALGQVVAAGLEEGAPGHLLEAVAVDDLEGHAVRELVAEVEAEGDEFLVAVAVVAVLAGAALAGGDGAAGGVRELVVAGVAVEALLAVVADGVGGVRAGERALLAVGDGLAVWAQGVRGLGALGELVLALGALGALLVERVVEVIGGAVPDGVLVVRARRARGAVGVGARGVPGASLAR